MKHLFAFALLILFANPFGLQAQDAGAPQQPINRFEAAANEAARANQAKESIERALSVLIPGGIPDGTLRKEKFSAVFDSFVKGDAKTTLDALKEMSAEDSDLPPAEIMLAGLTFAVGDNNSGLTLLESAAVKTPDYPGVYLSFAQLALNRNRITDASLHADKTARLIEGGNLSAVQKQHFLKQYYEIATSIYLRRKQNQKANETLDQLQKTEADLPFYFFTKAELAFRDGKNDQVLQYLGQHAKAINSKRLPQLTLVDWLKNSGKDAEAEQLLLKTVGENPQDAAALMMSAQMYMAKEEFGDALTTIEAFEKANGAPSNRSIDMKGRIAFAGLNYEKAAEQFRLLTARAPNDASNANILALCLVESDDVEQQKRALQLSQQVASRLTNNSLAIASLGYICLKNGRTEQAKQLMQRVVMMRQGTPEISWFLANFLATEGEKQQAAALLEKAVQTNGLFLYRTAARKMLTKLKE